MKRSASETSREAKEPKVEEEEKGEESEALYDEQHDFKHLFEAWKKRLPMNERLTLNRKAFGFDLDPFTVHKLVVESGRSYKEASAKDADGEEIRKKLVGALPVADSVKKTYKAYKANMANVCKNIVPFIQTLEKFIDHYNSRHERAEERTICSHLEQQASKLRSFLEELEKKRQFVNPNLKDSIKILVDKLDTVQEEIDAAMNEPEAPRSILWLGENGIGKSFMLNLLLMLSELPSFTYSLEISPTLEGVQDWEKRYPSAMEGDEINSMISATRSEVGDLPLQSEESGRSLVVVEPNPTDFPKDGGVALSMVFSSSSESTTGIPSQVEIQFELNYLDAVRRRAEDEKQWLEFKKSRDGVFPGYILTSAATGNRSTTRHITRIRYGSQWHFSVTYSSLDELKEMLLKYNFDVNEDIYKNSRGKWSQSEIYHHERMMKLLEAVVDHDAMRLARGGAEYVTEDEKEEEEEKPFAAFSGFDVLDMSDTGLVYPREGETLLFRDKIKRIAGRTFVFKGKGENPLKDRIYLRRMLHAVMFQGIDSECAPPPGTAPPTDGNAFKPASPDVAPDSYIISDIALFVPSILLTSGVEWQDAPGSHDDDPEKYLNLVKGLEKCDGVVLLSHDFKDLSVLDVLKEHIVPRVWKVDDAFSRVSSFLMKEKDLFDTFETLASWKAAPSRAKGLDADRKQLILNVLKRIMDPEFAQKHLHDPKHYKERKDVGRAMSTTLDEGTWHAFPLMYTSLLLDSSLRMSFGKLLESDWNPSRTPELQGEPPSKRKAANDALMMTFGRQLVDSLFNTGQSTVRGIIKDVQEAFRRAVDDLKDLIKQENAMLEPPPSSLEKEIKAKAKPNNFESEFNKIVDSDGTLQDIRKAVDVTKFIDSVQKAFRKDILDRIRADRQPAHAVNLFEQEKRYKARGMMQRELDSGLDLIPVKQVIAGAYRTALKRFEERMLEILQNKLVKVGSLGNDRGKSEEWLKVHVAKFWELQGRRIVFDRIAQVKKGSFVLGLVYGVEHGAKVEDKFLASVRDVATAARKAFDVELLRLVRTTVQTHFIASCTIRSSRSFGQKFTRHRKDEDQLAKLICSELEENFKNNFLPTVGEKIVSAIQKMVSDDLPWLTSALVTLKSSVCSILVDKFIRYVTRFASAKNGGDKFSESLVHAVGFVSNRMIELKEGGRLTAMDGLRFEVWVKSKFVLQHFLRENPSLQARATHLFRGTEDLRTQFLLVETASNAPEGSGVGARNRAVPIGDLRLAQELSNGSSSLSSSPLMTLKTGSERLHKPEGEEEGWPVLIMNVDESRQTADCLYLSANPLGPAALHRDAIKPTLDGDSVASRDQLVECIRKVVLLPPEVESSSLLACWAKLVEAAFPVLDSKNALNRLAGLNLKENQNRLFRVTTITGQREKMRACEDVFNDWFAGDFTLDDFLKDFQEDNSLRFAVPLLIGAAEMFATPFQVLLEENGKEYFVDPVFRTSESARKRAYLLKWSRAKGFEERRSDRTVGE